MVQQQQVVAAAAWWQQVMAADGGGRLSSVLSAGNMSDSHVWITQACDPWIWKMQSPLSLNHDLPPETFWATDLSVEST